MGSKLVRFVVQSFPSPCVIGKSVQQKAETTLDDPTIPDLWTSMANDGSLNILQAIPNRLTPNPDTVGWMGDWQPGAETYTYLAGVLVQPNTPVPDGFVSRDIESCDMAIGWIQGTDGDEGGDIHAQASAHLTGAMNEHGYEYDSSHGLFEMEYYSHERFRLAEQRGEKVILDFYTPCKKRIQHTP